MVMLGMLCLLNWSNANDAFCSQVLRCFLPCFIPQMIASFSRLNPIFVYLTLDMGAALHM